MPEHGPSGAHESKSRLEEAIASYEAARDVLRGHGKGQQPDQQEWLVRYPDVALALQAYFQDEDQLKKRLALLRPEEFHLRKGSPPLRAEEVTKSEQLEAIPGIEIRAIIGRGGMGSVYKAYQSALDRLVALKTVRREYLTKEGLEMFQREARLLAKCSHPNIVQIFAFDPEHAVPYFLMEYLDGVPLDQALHGRPWKERAFLFRDVVAAVASAHEYGVVHGDLKPSNILVDRRSKAHILDFGLASLTHGIVSHKGQSSVGGTPGYLAPELLERQASPGFASDIYALGITLYIVLTGLLPYENIDDARSGNVRLPMEHDSDIPEPLQRICLKAMEFYPQDRYQTAEFMQRDLERFCTGRPVLVRPKAYLRELEGRVQNHLTEIQSLEQQGFISRRERDGLVKPYGKVLPADSPWLSQARKVLAGPLLLRIGAWLFLLSSLLWPFFYWDRLGQAARVASGGVPTFLMGILGTVYVISGNRRNALACLGSFVLLLLVFEVVLMSEFGWLQYLQAREWELWGDQVHIGVKGGQFMLSNSQIFAAALSVTLCIVLLLSFLRAAFFAPWLAIACLGLFSAALLLIGDKERIQNERVAWVALHYVGFFIGLYWLGYWLERWSTVQVARPSYLVAVATCLVAAIALAGFGAEEWFGEKWLDGRLVWDNQIWNLWLMAYAIPFFHWAWLTERFGTEGQRTLAWFYYLLVPIFSLVPLNILFADKGLELFQLGSHPFRIYELLYLVVCIALLLIGKNLHIQSFLLASLGGFAVWIFRATVYHFDDYLSWPLGVGLLGGLLVALGVWRSYRSELPPEDRVRRTAPPKTKQTAQSGKQTSTFRS